MKNTLSTLIALLFVMIVVLSSCTKRILASSNQGMIVEVTHSKKHGGYYGYTVLRGKDSVAHYNMWMNIHYPYKIEAKEDVMIVTTRYIDSLINASKVK